MAVVLMKKVTALLTGEAEEVVIGASGRVIEAVLYDFDGNVQDITGWSAQIVGTSDDLPGVSIDVAGEIVSPASGGTFRWTRVGDFLTQIGEKSSARFRCQVKWTDADGLVDYSHAFQVTFVVDGTGEDTNMNAAAVQALIDAAVHKKLMTNKWQTLVHQAVLPPTNALNTGYKTSGYVDKPWGGAREIQVNSGGANKTFCHHFFNSVDQGSFPRPNLAQLGLFGVAWEYRMMMNAATLTQNAGECVMGISVGGPMGSQAPWVGREQYLLDNDLVGSFISLRYNFTLVRWEVTVWRVAEDDGATAAPIVVLPCDYNPPFTPDQYITEACLRYDPAPDGRSVLRAYLNGTLALTTNHANLQALYGRDCIVGPGYFVTSGSNASQVIGDAIFYEGHWWSENQSEWAPA